MEATSRERKRVAILGGGAGSLAAAFELTATPELRQAYDLTVYQLGWRCGGKGASGRRDINGALRIEEHGLHVWFGFYENAFDVMRRIYEELDRPEGAALRTWQDAFHPTNEVVLCDDTEDDRWIPRRFHFPPNDALPGLPGDPPSLHDLMRDAIHTLRLIEPPDHAKLHLRALDKFFDAFLLAAEKLMGEEKDDGESEMTRLFEGFMRFARPLLHLRDDDDDPESPDEPLICKFLKGLTDVIWAITGGDRYAMTFDVTATVFRGILSDDLDDRAKGGFAQVNGEEFMAWMKRHGARQETLDQSPILRAFYQLCFGYKDGDRAQPCIAAGKALQAMLRMCLGYKGAIMWKMQAGMGDAIFAPMYEALRARGVRFEFFHDVTNIGTNEAGTLVDEITVRRQAKTKNGAEYLPLIPDVGGLMSWPAEPLFDQLEGGAEAYRDVFFERCQSGPDAEDITLRVGEDFDLVVMGMSVASLPDITKEIAATDPKFQAMLDHAETVATLALQVWMTDTPERLGPTNPKGMISGAYVKPLDTLCDMSHLLDREGWAAAGLPVTSIGYFCGTMAKEEESGDQEEADRRAFAAGVTHLKDHSSILWPGSITDDAFAWALLYDHQDADGDGRVASQYWRANIFGSERYVLTPPGSIEHRMRPSEAKATNLALAGDWTRNGVCGGSVEAAVTSGKLAAQHLSGHPAVIPGTEGWLESD
ncbi:NAD(P)-binding protein [Conexibacter woesei]|uniref:NAD(P)-binding protein n=1 Tax=Conexibacter woesei TaxID=191495 RepID=UPI00040DE038|nr:NAD(P)-binding protein [Conexibacter woesei]